MWEYNYSLVDNLSYIDTDFPEAKEFGQTVCLYQMQQTFFVQGFFYYNFYNFSVNIIAIIFSSPLT